MGALAPPRVFEDRPSYRLLAVAPGPSGAALPAGASGPSGASVRAGASGPSRGAAAAGAAGARAGDGVRLAFGPGTYFGVVDVSEAVAHELAAATRTSIAAPSATRSPVASPSATRSPVASPSATRSPIADPSGAPPTREGVPVAAPALADLPRRSAIGDPLDLGRRVVVPAITALTLRRTADGRARFLLHGRDAAKVAHGGGLTQVAPVGVFQAAGSDPASQRLDLDLWRCLTREYSEELLGAPEHRGDGGPLDHEGWPFARALAAARRTGTVRAHWLGLGVDPLSLVADLLVAVVVDAPAFDELFAGLVATNDEGDLVAGDGTADGPSVTGFPFTAATVERLLVDEPMQAAGAAVLDLAWRHRASLLA
jgi:hypothetical protein